MYLSREFTTIYILPRQKGQTIRYIPENVKIADDLIIDSFRIYKQRISLILSACLGIVTEAFQSRNGYRYFFNFKHFLYTRIEAGLLSLKIYKWVLANDINQAKVYSYWSDTSVLECCFLKEKGIFQNLVCRAHGFDIYDNRNTGGIIPFRSRMYKNVDEIYCISNHGKNYLINKLPRKWHYKIHVAYLGVKSPKELMKFDNETIPIIVSCARMEIFKRISLIARILNLIKTPVHWIHFGDGPEFETVSKMTDQFPAHIKVTMMGQRKHSEILEFYSSHKISLFISLSLSEGLPVSMMEAISYGIPILSTNINGTPEIVTAKTGILVSISEPIENIVEKIHYVLQTNPFDSEEIKRFYFENFNADINYSKFAKEIAECTL